MPFGHHIDWRRAPGRRVPATNTCAQLGSDDGSHCGLRRRRGTEARAVRARPSESRRAVPVVPGPAHCGPAAGAAPPRPLPVGRVSDSPAGLRLNSRLWTPAAARARGAPPPPPRWSRSTAPREPELPRHHDPDWAYFSSSVAGVGRGRRNSRTVLRAGERRIKLEGSRGAARPAAPSAQSPPRSSLTPRGRPRRRPGGTFPALARPRRRRPDGRSAPG